MHDFSKSHYLGNNYLLEVKCFNNNKAKKYPRLIFLNLCLCKIEVLILLFFLEITGVFYLLGEKIIWFVVYNSH